MLAQVNTFRRKEQNGAIECTDFAFDNADHQIDRILLCCSAQHIHRGSRNIDRTVKVPSKVVSPLRRSETHTGTEIETLGISGNERFGKDHKLRPGLGSIRRQLTHPGERPLAIEDHWTTLNDSRAESSHSPNCSMKAFMASLLTAGSGRLSAGGDEVSG